MKSLKIQLESFYEDLNQWSFIQVGACDGIRGDPIHDMILQYNWNGILIEPITEVFEKLCENYSKFDNLIFENVAIHPSKKNMDLFYYPKDNSLTSFNRKVRKLKKIAKSKIQKIKVDCMSLNNIIKKYDIDHIDLLQIDTEGFDYSVIRSLDFNLIKPSNIHFEFHLLRKEELKECKKYLSSMGYIRSKTSKKDMLWKIK